MKKSSHETIESAPPILAKNPTKTTKLSDDPKFENIETTILFWQRPWTPFAKSMKDFHCHNDFNCKFEFGSPKPTSSQLKHADAVVFSPVFNRELPPDFSYINKLRRTDQIYVNIQTESPQYHRINYKVYDGFFNATMTYRQDSTFFAPYGTIISTNKFLSIIRVINLLKLNIFKISFLYY